MCKTCSCPWILEELQAFAAPLQNCHALAKTNQIMSSTTFQPLTPFTAPGTLAAMTNGFLKIPLAVRRGGLGVCSLLLGSPCTLMGRGGVTSLHVMSSHVISCHFISLHLMSFIVMSWDALFEFAFVYYRRLTYTVTKSYASTLTLLR